MIDDDVSSSFDELRSQSRLEQFFMPRSVAIVGASEKSFWTRNAIRNLDVLGFSGQLALVNPRRSEIFGRPCFESLLSLRDAVDLAYIAAPTEAVPGVLNDAKLAGVRNVVVVAAGFGEVGHHGKALQNSLVHQAKLSGVTLLGPNCPGFLNAADRVAAYGQEIPIDLPTGNIGVILQSGALASAVLKFSQAYGIGLSSVVCMGNEAIIRAADVLEYMIGNKNTHVIAMFLEQIREGGRFLTLARRALSLGKPIVILKVGRTPAGQRTALAHTGAIAGDEAVIDAALRQSGVVRVRSLEELLLTAGLMSQDRRPVGRRMAVVTSSGGACDIIADRASDEGIELPEFSTQTKSELSSYLPGFATVQNPLDGAAVDTMRETGTAAVPMDIVAETVSRDPRFDFLLYMGFNMIPVSTPAEADRQSIVDRIKYVGTMMRNSPIPIVAVSQTCLATGPFARSEYKSSGIFVLGGIEFGVSAIGNVLRWEEARLKANTAAEAIADQPQVGRVPSAFSDTIGTWSEAKGRDLLKKFDVPMVPANLVKDVEAALVAAEQFGYPAVLKICSGDIPHKSDVGGVALNLRNSRELRIAFENVTAAASAVSDASIDGILVSPMRSGGIELFVGVKFDQTFGSTLAVGLGGIWIEVLRDVALRVLPVSPEEIEEMLDSLKARSILEGARGTLAVNKSVLAKAIWRIAQAGLALGPRLEALEVNPLWCRESQVEALDVLVAMKAAD